MRNKRLIAAVSILTVACLGLAPRDDESLSTEAKKTPPATTAPATRPVAALLLGVYRGTVVDDDETVPCVTTFRLYNGRITGTYVVREGDDRYDGTLDGFKLLSDERGECRFRWHDKNGEGFVTVHVTPDGLTFEGSWGLEVVQAKLVWTGTRDAKPAESPSEGSGEKAASKPAAPSENGGRVPARSRAARRGS